MSPFVTALEQHAQLVRQLYALEEPINSLAEQIATTFKKGGKLLLAGNGGSAADCQHLAAEFVGRFTTERRALPVLALTTDTSTLTSLANDYGFEKIFSRQVEALGGKEDLLLVISTSGNSANLLSALQTAKTAGITSATLLGSGGGAATGVAEFEIIIPSQSTPRIQELQIFIGHYLCEQVERLLGLSSER